MQHTLFHMRLILVFSIVSFLFSSCGVLKQLPKNELTNGNFTYINIQKRKTVYIENHADTLIGFSEQKAIFHIPLTNTKDESYLLHKASFDIDVLTIPVKFRGGQQNIPNQLISEINASLYLGLRNDLFKINYPIKPSGTRNRSIEHVGFSLGGLIGIGNSVINADVTNSAIINEYQGILMTKGIAGIIAINNFTVGVAYGWDHLLDSNQNNWIYHQKPWIGLSFGLNLN